MKLVLLILMIAPLVRAEFSADELTRLATKVRASVLLMTATDEAGKPVAVATGFIVSDDGKLVTNRHVANAGPRLTAKAPGGRQYRVAGVLAEDSDQDLVVLKIENSRQPSLTLAGDDDPREGLPVIMVGNPLQLESTVQQGTISGFRTFLGTRRWIEVTGAIAGKNVPIHRELVHGQGLQVVTEIAPGSSGSPVLDAEGRVLGVITAIERSEPPVALAIPVEAVRQLLGRAQRAGVLRPLESLSRRVGNDLSTDVEYAAAVTAYSTNDLEEAQLRARTVTERYPESPVAYLLMGQVNLQRHSYAEAVDAFGHAIELKRELAPAWAGLAVAYVGAGLKDRARDSIREVEKLDAPLAKHLSVTLPTLAY